MDGYWEPEVENYLGNDEEMDTSMTSLKESFIDAQMKRHEHNADIQAQIAKNEYLKCVVRRGCRIVGSSNRYGLDNEIKFTLSILRRDLGMKWDDQMDGMRLEFGPCPDHLKACMDCLQGPNFTALEKAKQTSEEEELDAQMKWHEHNAEIQAKARKEPKDVVDVVTKDI